LFNVLEIILYFHDILIVSAGSTSPAKTGVTESARCSIIRTRLLWLYGVWFSVMQKSSKLCCI